MNQIRVLITDASHPVTPGAIESLREIESENFYFIGVDHEGNKEPVASLWVEKHYLVPSLGNAKFAREIFNISVKEGVNIVVPWTNEDAVEISRLQTKFSKKGIKLLCGSVETIEKVIDKGKLFRALKDADLPVPKFLFVNSLDDIKQAAKELGYPRKLVVAKPRNLSGKRGFCTLDAHSDLASRRFGYHLPLESFVELIRKSREIKENNLNYILMEYLPGPDYSCDTLAYEGKPLIIIPRLRLVDKGGVSLIGETVYKNEINKLVFEVITHFKLHLNANIQIKYSKIRGGTPYVYDVNPRISGSISANAGAGLNLFYYGILLALGRPIPNLSDLSYEHVKVIRRWKEEYVHYKVWYRV